MMVKPARRGKVALLALCLAGCAGEGDPATVAVGLTTDMAIGFDLHRVEIVTAVDGAVVEEQRWSYTEGDLLLPAELSIEAQDGAEVEVTALSFGKAEPEPFVTRTAATRATSGRTPFLPVFLGEGCSGVSCAAGSTCVEGACVDAFIAPSALEDHDPSWIDSAPDACKTPSSGEPAVLIGLGQSGFAPLGDDVEEVPIEAGAQGGFHVWLALRVSGLRQMGSHLTLAGGFPEIDVELAPVTTVVTLRKAEDGQCEIYGVRFRVDAGLPVETIRGQALDIEVTLEDPNSDAATATQRVVIAP